MSILDVTEDQIFQTLGKGRDPNFKQIEKVRPAVVKSKKTYTLNQTVRATQTVKPVQQQVKAETAVAAVETPPPHGVDESMKNLSLELGELNNRVNGIQKMIKWYIVPQFVVVLALLLALIARS
ncbi:MAG: hypothetical protein OIN66_04780 [Candidatus Methanoperedens sp.]|nr:hypothetical protein [Candidatus Methanoperedens sp.]